MTMLLENLRLAVGSLLANKMRSLLTMLGIIIGIAAVIAIMTLGNSVTENINSSMQALGANNINVTLTRREQEQEVTMTARLTACRIPAPGSSRKTTASPGR